MNLYFDVHIFFRENENAIVCVTVHARSTFKIRLYFIEIILVSIFVHKLTENICNIMLVLFSLFSNLCVWVTYDVNKYKWQEARKYYFSREINFYKSLPIYAFKSKG